MPQTSLRQTVALVFFSLILSLLILEVSLRITGSIFLWKKERENRLNFSRQNSYRILCLGESTTFLGGEDSYPSQLERILNSRLPKKSVKVINKGIPGANTNQILEHAPKWLDEYQPDLVLIMMGINDPPALVPRNKLTPAKKIFLLAHNLRISKLSRWIIQAWKKKNNSSLAISSPIITSNSIKQTENNGGEEAQKQAFQTASPLLKQIIAMAMLFEANGALPSAETAYRKAIPLSDDKVIREWIYLRLEKNLQQQQKYDAILDILEFIPHHSWIEDWVERYCVDTQTAESMQRLLDNRIQQSPKMTLFFTYKAICYARSGDTVGAEHATHQEAILRRDLINLTTQTNYTELLSLLNERNIQPVIVQYALLDPSDIQNMLEGHVDTKKLMIIDNREFFQKALSTSSYEEIFTDRFAGAFGHCTPRGNFILAENIAEVLIRTAFIK